MREFGRPVVYTPASTGVPVDLAGVFDAAFQQVNMETGEITTLENVLSVRIADIGVDPAEHDRVSIDGAAYLVIQSQKDGQGGARLLLQKRP